MNRPACIEPRIIEGRQWQRLYVAQMWQTIPRGQNAPLLDVLIKELLPPWRKAQEVYASDYGRADWPPLATSCFRAACGLMGKSLRTRIPALIDEGLPWPSLHPVVIEACHHTRIVLSSYFLDGYADKNGRVADNPWIRAAVIDLVELLLGKEALSSEELKTHSLITDGATTFFLCGDPSNAELLAAVGISPLTHKVRLTMKLLKETNSASLPNSIAKTVTFSVRVPAYNPTKDQSEWVKTVQKAVAAQAKKHIEKQKRRALRWCGFVSTKGEIKNMDNIRLLALYQIGGRPYRDLAEDSTHAADVLLKNIRNAAKVCRLPLRPDKLDGAKRRRIQH